MELVVRVQREDIGEQQSKVHVLSCTNHRVYTNSRVHRLSGESQTSWCAGARLLLRGTAEGCSHIFLTCWL